MRTCLLSLGLFTVLAVTACGGTEFSAGGAPAGQSGAAGVGGGASGAAGSSATGGSGAGGSAAGSGGSNAGTGGASGGTAQGGAGGSLGGAAGGPAGAAGVGAAAGSAGNGGAGNGGAGSGGAGAGGSGNAEACLNGKDDDGDALADCADSDCQATFTCAPAPMGAALGVGFIDQKLDAPCPSDFPTKTKLFELSALEVPPSACACACSAPTTETCKSVLACGPLCTTPQNETALTEACTPVKGLVAGTGVACTAGKPVVASGPCTPTPPAAPGPATWTATARSCVRAAGGACAEPGQVCVPKAPGDAPLCLLLPGDVACPASAPTKTLYFDGKLVDTRACDTSECSCGGAVGGACSCGGGCTVDLFSDGMCGGAVDTSFTPNGNVCKVLSPIATGGSAQLVGAVVSKHGKCEAAGTAASKGGVEPKTALTACCP